MPLPDEKLKWWAVDRDDNFAVAKAVWGIVKRMEDNSKDRHLLDTRHMRLYGGTKYAGITPTTYYRFNAEERVSWNVIAASINTYVAKITKARPAPFFVTNGADYDLRRKGKKLNKFGKGLLHATGAYELSAEVERDAAVFGTCPTKVFSEGKKICLEKVFPWEIFVDNVEAMYGKPRTMAQRKYVDRDVLKALYPKFEAELDNCSRAEKAEWGTDVLADQLEVWEIWRMPSQKGADDGRHVVVVEKAALVDEGWTRTKPPFVFRRWEKPIIGFWGTGVAERVTGIQVEINKLLRRIKEAHHLLGRPLVILPSNAGIPKSHLTNEVGAILISEAGMGDPIAVHAPPTMPPDVYSHLQVLRQSAFEEIGVSQLSVASRKPAGIESGAAIREFNDIETERFLDKGRSREEWFMEIVEAGLEEAREIEGFYLDVADSKERTRVEWKDIDLDKEAYTLQVFPVSVLPQHPSGRLQKVQELVRSRMLPMDRAFDLLEIPDLDDYRNERLAAEDAIRFNIESILDGEDFQTPESFDNLARVVELGTSYYLRERSAGAPEDRLSALRRYIEAAHAEYMKSQPQQPEQSQTATPPTEPVQAAQPQATQ